MVARVVVVDDHRVFADALAARLDLEPDLHVVGVATTSRAALSLCVEHAAALAVVDLRLGRENGIDLVRDLRTSSPSTRSVIVTGSEDEGRVVDAVREGAHGWVPKGANTGQLLEALRCAARGELWFEPATLTRLVKAFLVAEQVRTEAQQLGDSLTARERDVLVCLAEGLNQSGTAERLFLSPNTVRTHRRNVLAKLGVHSSLEAVAAARRFGLVAQPEPVPSRD
jgi:DNA-binding NarL/FixJ family response regulator